MRSYNDDMDELIGKVLSGEASREEQETIEQWRKASNENAKHYSDFELIFSKASRQKEHQEFDTDVAWLKVKDKLDKNRIAAPEEYDKKIIPLRSIVLKIAASIVLIVAVTFAFYTFTGSNPDEMLALATTDTTSQTTLPDGTVVFLNKATQLEANYNTKKNINKVKLSGEAHFAIRHDDEKKFIIDAGGVFIEDIGTIFNVQAYPDRKTIEVMVEEGEVRFYSETDTGLTIREGGYGIYNRETGKFSIDRIDTNVMSYKTRVFSFQDDDLLSIINRLNMVYTKPIRINEQVQHCRLTVAFQNEDIESIAEVIAEALNLALTITSGEIILSGESCEE